MYTNDVAWEIRILSFGMEIKQGYVAYVYPYELIPKV